jgi:hypothetical protein
MFTLTRFSLALCVAVLAGLTIPGIAHAQPSLKPKPGTAVIPNPAALICCRTRDNKAVLMTPQKCRLIRGTQMNSGNCKQVCCRVKSSTRFTTLWQCRNRLRGRTVPGGHCRLSNLPAPSTPGAAALPGSGPVLMCCRTRDKKAAWMRAETCRKIGGREIPIGWCRSERVCCQLHDGRFEVIQATRCMRPYGVPAADPRRCEGSLELVVCCRTASGYQRMSLGQCRAPFGTIASAGNCR